MKTMKEAAIVGDVCDIVCDLLCKVMPDVAWTYAYHNETEHISFFSNEREYGVNVNMSSPKAVVKDIAVQFLAKL